MEPAGETRRLASIPDGLDQQAKGHCGVTPIGVIDVVPREARAPISQHTDQPAIRDVVSYLGLRHVGETAVFEGCGSLRG